ncbi:hypothetical protein I316_01573 [Kwoniella heveanensis BCC8398]|uniref:Uncharacterized protein n=1 Tax=Kwoniella heveanensis BCC8398 TaxID=1296120 RepID=A0A1B9H131_9TREE|nr:hypothetical protein I316_01573 [Kwoniella heveanensis BCC8398]
MTSRDDGTYEQLDSRFSQMGLSEAHAASHESTNTGLYQSSSATQSPTGFGATTTSGVPEDQTMTGNDDQNASPGYAETRPNAAIWGGESGRVNWRDPFREGCPTRSAHPSSTATTAQEGSNYMDQAEADSNAARNSQTYMPSAASHTMTHSSSRGPGESRTGGRTRKRRGAAQQLSADQLQQLILAAQENED